MPSTRAASTLPSVSLRLNWTLVSTPGLGPNKLQPQIAERSRAVINEPVNNSVIFKRYRSVYVSIKLEVTSRATRERLQTLSLVSVLWKEL